MTTINNEAPMEAMKVASLLVGTSDEAVKFQKALALRLPKGMDENSYFLMCYKAIRQGCTAPDTYREAPLKTASLDSVKNAILDAAAHGLTLTGFNNQADLIVRKGVCRTEVNAKGIKDLAFRTDLVASLDVFSYCEGDTIVDIRGANPVFSVTLAHKEDAKQLGTVGILTLKNGCFIVEVMSMKEMVAYQDKMLASVSDKARPYATWNTHFQRMIEKTITKRLCSKMPFLGAQSVQWGTLMAMSRMDETPESDPVVTQSTQTFSDALGRLTEHLKNNPDAINAIEDEPLPKTVITAPQTPAFDENEPLLEDTLAD